MHAFSDVDDDDVAGATEEIAGPFVDRPHRRSPPAGGGCLADKPCTWNHNTASSWNTNRRRTRSRPSTSPTASTTTSRRRRSASPTGSFDGEQRSAASCRPTTARSTVTAAECCPTRPPQQREHVHAARRQPAGDADVPVAAAELPDDERRRRRLDRLPRVHARALEPAGHRRRRARRAELAAGRGDGGGLERLVRQGLPRHAVPEARHRRPSATWTWASTPTPRRTRSAPRGSTAPSARRRRSCPGDGTAGSGGYTYGDFGRIAGGQEVHADGEIWAETLWDLRDAPSGSGRPALRLVTDGMRLSPPEPTFLDMRNAILLADQAAGGANATAIWSVFAHRGMGYYASTNEGTSVPLRGLLAAARAGRSARPDRRCRARQRDRAADRRRRRGDRRARRRPGPAVGTSGGDGAFAIESVPARTYPSLVITRHGLRHACQRRDRRGRRDGGGEPGPGAQLGGDRRRRDDHARPGQRRVRRPGLRS